jgi:putative SOS response-associated peptidase YedK
MCYDAAFLTKKAEDYAKRHGEISIWERALAQRPAMYHVNGFSEPELPVITAQAPDEVQFFQWGFIPMVYAPKVHGRPLNTLNARNDKIFTSRSIYKKAAQSQRCLVMMDGFFDHHKKDGIAYPFYVRLKSGKPFFVAGLWQNFLHKRDEISLLTVTLVTGPANKEMAWIHNEPAYSSTSRMIYIVDPEDDETWLTGDAEQAADCIAPLPDGSLEYHPCPPVRSNKKLQRTYMGNTPEIQKQYHYPELEGEQESLF